MQGNYPTVKLLLTYYSSFIPTKCLQNPKLSVKRLLRQKDDLSGPTMEMEGPIVGFQSVQESIIGLLHLLSKE
jgi:hypothetical protein